MLSHSCLWGRTLGEVAGIVQLKMSLSEAVRSIVKTCSHSFAMGKSMSVCGNGSVPGIFEVFAFHGKELKQPSGKSTFIFPF